MNRLPILAALLAVSAMTAAVPAQAQDAFYETHPDRGLHFADLEFGMTDDPLLPTTLGLSHVIHTPAQYLADANGKLHAAIPAGTEAATAAAILMRAGAHCAQPTNGMLTCGYRDVETPWGGEYFDAIKWTVTLPLADGRVTDLTVTRDWTRR